MCLAPSSWLGRRGKNGSYLVPRVVPAYFVYICLCVTISTLKSDSTKYIEDAEHPVFCRGFIRSLAKLNINCPSPRQMCESQRKLRKPYPKVTFQ